MKKESTVHEKKQENYENGEENLFEKRKIIRQMILCNKMGKLKQTHYLKLLKKEIARLLTKKNNIINRKNKK